MVALAVTVFGSSTVSRFFTAIIPIFDRRAGGLCAVIRAGGGRYHADCPGAHWFALPTPLYTPRFEMVRSPDDSARGV